jgi:hypothetical protein
MKTKFGAIGRELRIFVKSLLRFSHAGKFSPTVDSVLFQNY